MPTRLLLDTEALAELVRPPSLLRFLILVDIDILASRSAVNVFRFLVFFMNDLPTIFVDYYSWDWTFRTVPHILRLCCILGNLKGYPQFPAPLSNFKLRKFTPSCMGSGLMARRRTTNKQRLPNGVGLVHDFLPISKLHGPTLRIIGLPTGVCILLGYRRHYIGSIQL